MEDKLLVYRCKRGSPQALARVYQKYKTDLLFLAMAELPFEQREVVLMHLHGSMTFGAIARARQISTNTARSRYRYGLDKLRLLLNGEVTR